MEDKDRIADLEYEFKQLKRRVGSAGFFNIAVTLFIVGLVIYGTGNKELYEIAKWVCVSAWLLTGLGWVTS